MDTLTSAKLDASIEAFLKGAKFEVGAPRFDNGEDRADGEKPWPSVAWDIKLVSKEGRVILAFPYRSGLACVEDVLASKMRPVPDLRSVLFCILSDGTACFNHQSFREWCLDLGYSNDSIRARQCFDTCYETGAALAAAFGADACEKMLEAFYDANF